MKEPDEEEILKEIRNLKNRKAAGEDGLEAELLKNGGQQLYNRITHLVKLTLVAEQDT